MGSLQSQPQQQQQQQYRRQEQSQDQEQQPRHDRSSSSLRNRQSHNHLHARSDSSTLETQQSKSVRTRGGSQSHHRFFRPSFSSFASASGGSGSASGSGLDSGLDTVSSGTAIGSRSESSSTYDYTLSLSPSSSVSPTLTRVETLHHYNHVHGSSLDSYYPQTPGEENVDPFSQIETIMGAATSAEKLPKQQRGGKDGGDSPHTAPLAVPTRTKSQSSRRHRVAASGGGGGGGDSTPHSGSGSPAFKPSAPPSTTDTAQRERESVSSVSSSYGANGAPSNFSQPPRLPLPIQEEELAPGSPVIAPRDFRGGLGGEHVADHDEELFESRLVPNKSLLSQTTADEDEEDEDGAHHHHHQDPHYHGPGEPIDHPATTGSGSGSSGQLRNRKVPTEVTWRGHADKIYVTGTFVGWSRKFRMQYDPALGGARTVLELSPGTHHVRFIVDGEMTLSDDLPTAVDYTNTLVNYIEVGADAAFRKEQDQLEDDYRGEGLSGPAPESVHPPLVVPRKQQQQQQQQQGADLPSFGGLSAGQPPDLLDQLTPGSERGTSTKAPSSAAPTTDLATGRKGVELMELPPRRYGQVIPQYLADLDRDERTSRFARASARVSEMPPPPTLPGMLTKSILNMPTPAKDDSSVLPMPNHTMLNHLATSSIRQGVLATSLTTRYKRKYVTLITYRPTSLDE